MTTVGDFIGFLQQYGSDVSVVCNGETLEISYDFATNQLMIAKKSKSITLVIPDVRER